MHKQLNLLLFQLERIVLVLYPLIWQPCPANSVLVNYSAQQLTTPDQSPCLVRGQILRLLVNRKTVMRHFGRVAGCRGGEHAISSDANGRTTEQVVTGPLPDRFAATHADTELYRQRGGRRDPRRTINDKCENAWERVTLGRLIARGECDTPSAKADRPFRTQKRGRQPFQSTASKVRSRPAWYFGGSDSDVTPQITGLTCTYAPLELCSPLRDTRELLPPDAGPRVIRHIDTQRVCIQHILGFGSMKTQLKMALVSLLVLV